MGVLDMMRQATISDRRRGLEAGRLRTSPPFNFRNIGTFAVSEAGYYDIEEAVGSFSCEAQKKAKRFMPFANASIQNNSDNIIEFWINRDVNNKVTVLNRATQDLSNMELWRWTVKNISTTSTIAPDKIVISVWNE